MGAQNAKFLIDVWIWRDNRKKEGKDQESLQSSTTPGPGYPGYQWESDNFTIRHNKREPRGQPFPNRWTQGITKQPHIKA